MYAQTEADAGRFRELGAPVAGVFGNLKFEATPDASQLATGRVWRRALRKPVLLFASSREGEEDEFLKQISAAAQAQRAQEAPDSIANRVRPAFKALIVPRHPQRFDEIVALTRAPRRCSPRSGSATRWTRWRWGDIFHDFDFCSRDVGLPTAPAQAHNPPGQQGLKISIPYIERLAGGSVQQDLSAAGGDQ